MRRINRRLMLGWTGAMLAGPVMAQPMGMQRGPGGGGPGFGRGMNDPASYLAALKAELHISPAQEPAWKDYADVVEIMGNQMRAMHANVYESIQTAIWQERQEMMNAMFQSRDEAHRMV
ncbi:MAG: Spy/CpxP family protein refolding chaperone, partial [Rhodopila sp.]